MGNRMRKCNPMGNARWLMGFTHLFVDEILVVMSQGRKRKSRN